MAEREGTTEKMNEEISGNADGMSQPKKRKYQEESDFTDWSVADVKNFLKSNECEDEIIAKFVGKMCYH